MHLNFSETSLEIVVKQEVYGDIISLKQ